MEVTVSLRTQLFYPQGKKPRYTLDRGCVTPRAGLHVVAKIKILFLTLAENRFPVVQQMY
jgi:hypothetical protein